MLTKREREILKEYENDVSIGQSWWW